MKPFKPTSILLLALALTACESNDPNPDNGLLLPITTGTAQVEAMHPGEVPMRSTTTRATTLPYTSGEICLYTTADGETYDYNLSANGELNLTYGTAPMAHIGTNLAAHAFGYVAATDLTLGDVFVRTAAATHPVVAGAEVDEAGITLALTPAAARIRIKIVGCYGETETQNAALAPSITLNPDIFDIPARWIDISNPGSGFPAELAPGTNPVPAFTGISPQLIPTTIAAGQAPTMLTLTFDDNALNAYAGRTYTVFIPAGGITLEAAQTNVYTITLKGGNQVAGITDVQIEPFENEGNTEWNNTRMRTNVQLVDIARKCKQ